eukprot:c40779_g1_i1.p1 GENE.c40779_g1_i1~~c40779_g1_i1.p1  ORF type:complete len:180 (-),score=30.36 c40779_g1_i1:45-557(-)
MWVFLLLVLAQDCCLGAPAHSLTSPQDVQKGSLVEEVSSLIWAKEDVAKTTKQEIDEEPTQPITESMSEIVDNLKATLHDEVTNVATELKSTAAETGETIMKITNIFDESDDYPKVHRRKQMQVPLEATTAQPTSGTAHKIDERAFAAPHDRLEGFEAPADLSEVYNYKE